MAWELTWPLTLIDLVVVVLIHGVLIVEGEALDSIWAVAAFFVVSPWVVRRALARAYEPARVVVIRGGEEHTKLKYQESLKVMWLLAWRALPLMLAALLVISLALRVAGIKGSNFSIDDPLENALGLSTIDALSSLLFSPFLIPGMMRKRYRGFHLDLKIPQSARK
jgi:hypothetical protein